MTRYAPTLLVGLGGSGVKVLRWIRDRQIRGGSSPVDDLLVYRGIDFDIDANSGSRAGRLANGEFFYYDPTTIADCIANLRAEVRGTPGKPPRSPFAEIAEWYPDLDGRYIRYAQAEAVGARQWRPLGRIGFFQNDVEIMQPLREGLVELDARCSKTGEMRPASVCIVTSIAGGTGSGILLDVAANLRKARPDIGVRLVLLLPEFFEHVDFTSKVLANAYATLLEIAHFKNQHERFTARYPRLPRLDERFQNALFQRVYLLGPYVGSRRPFVEPDLAFAHVAELLHVFLTKELRSNAASYQINDDADQNADSAALTAEDGALPVFCGFAAKAIRLLSYDDLAARWAASFVEHWGQTYDRTDIFAHVQKPPSPEQMRQLEDFIASTAAPAEALRHVAPDNFAKLVDEFTASSKPKNEKWTKELLQSFTERLAEFTGAGGKGAPQFLGPPVEAFRDAFRMKLRELIDQFPLTPFAVAAELRAIAERLRRQPKPADLDQQVFLADFHDWLGGTIDWFLAEPLVPVRIQLLKQRLQLWMTENGHDFTVASFVFGIHSAAIVELDTAIQQLDRAWSGGDELIAALHAATDAMLQRNTRRHERVDVDLDQVRPAAEILAIEMERLDRQRDRMEGLTRAMLGGVRQRIAEANRTRDHHAAAAGLLDDLRDLFMRELQPGGRVEGGTQTRFRYLSPKSTYDDDVIRRAVLSASSRLFRPGRIDSALRKRSGRLLVPHTFAGSEAVSTELRQLCSSLLGASMREVTADVIEENRILILVEDLFHSAEEVTGIYDYYNDYGRQKRELFHIRKDIASTFRPLITTLDAPGPHLCGNPGCKHDLKGTARTEILCAGCGAPIRNRCGNICSMDDLTARPDRTAAVEHGHCPVCEQPLRTYWWFCARHGRQPADAAECPPCIRERQPTPGRRPFSVRIFVCPACTRRRRDQPFGATGDLAAMLLGEWDGQGGSEHPVLVRMLALSRNCPQCGVELAPLCRAAGPPHLLRKLGHRWHCDVHTTDLFACGVCGFPLSPDEYSCRRCETTLVDCRFCTPAHGVRAADTADAECPRCRLPRRVPFAAFPPLDEDPADRFCSNVFGCPVGADLFATTYPRRTRQCAICESEEPTLFEVRTRSMHVDACTFCQALFGRRHGYRPASTGSPAGGGCCLCGQTFSATKKLGQAQMSFDVALKIGAALLDSQDDMVAFGLLFDSLPAAERHHMRSHIRDFALRVQRPAVRKIVHPRLEHLLEQYGRQFGCQSKKTIVAQWWDQTELAGAREPDEEETIEQVLSRERLSGLQTNGDFERWVHAVARLGIDYDRFDAALGRSSGDSTDTTTERLEELREHARALYWDLTTR